MEKIGAMQRWVLHTPNLHTAPNIPKNICKGTVISCTILANIVLQLCCQMYKWLAKSVPNMLVNISPCEKLEQILVAIIVAQANCSAGRLVSFMLTNDYILAGIESCLAVISAAFFIRVCHHI